MTLPIGSENRFVGESKQQNRTTSAQFFNQTSSIFQMYVTTILPEVRHSCPDLLDRSFLVASRTSVHAPVSVDSLWVRLRKVDPSFIPLYMLLDSSRQLISLRLSCWKGERLRGVRAGVLHGIEQGPSVVRSQAVDVVNGVDSLQGQTFGSIKIQTSTKGKG